jgi:hypothetical protein
MLLLLAVLAFIPFLSYWDLLTVESSTNCWGVSAATAGR